MKRLIDTHCHIFTEEFREDLSDVMGSAIQNGLEYLLLPNINTHTVKDMLSVCDRWPEICKPMIGLHPEDLDEDNHVQLDELKGLLDEDMGVNGPHRFIGIGETGLDMYWDGSRIREQIDSFRIQIEWALEYDLPLSIHSRNAFEELLGVLADYKGRGLRGVFHCFSGSTEEALKLLEFDGFMFGIGGVLTFKKSGLSEVVKVLPPERVVLETDSPYLAPVPFRGKRNEPSFITYTASCLASIYGCSVDEVSELTSRNARHLFRLS